MMIRSPAHQYRMSRDNRIRDPASRMENQIACRNETDTSRLITFGRLIRTRKLTPAIENDPMRATASVR